MKHHTLYNADRAGRIRIWLLESEGNKFRTIAGLEDGQHTISGWTICEGKNKGQANETTPEQQCQREVEAEYTKKLAKKYHENKDTVGGFKFFECMLAHKWKDRQRKVDVSKKVFSQPKLDGYRCSMAYAEAISRGGKSYFTVKHIMEVLKPVFEKYPDTRFDGELYNHALKADFNSLGSVIKKQKPTADDLEKAAELVQYHIYDLPSHKGTFGERCKALWAIFDEFDLDKHSCIQFVQTEPCTSIEEIDESYAKYLEQGYEGQIIRTNDAHYEGGRHNQLLKRKEFFDAEFEVVGFEEGNGNWAGTAKSVFFKMPDGKKTKSGEYPSAGIKGSKEFAAELLKGKLPLTTTVRYPNLTPDGIPRFPIAVDFQWEKGRVY